MGTYVAIPSQVCSLFIENSFQISKSNPTESTQKSSTTILRVRPVKTHLKDIALRTPVNSQFQSLHKNYPDNESYTGVLSAALNFLLQISSPTTPRSPTTSTNSKSIPIKPGYLTFHFDRGGIGSSRLLPPSSPVLAKALRLRDEGTKRVFLKAIGVFK